MPTAWDGARPFGRAKGADILNRRIVPSDQPDLGPMRKVEGCDRESVDARTNSG